jgi:hypothetical protein
MTEQTQTSATGAVLAKITPSRKTGSGALAGALSVVVVWGIGLTGISIPPEIASAFTVLCHFVVAWLVPNAAAADEG